jgi:hypothetical protein
VTIEDTSARSVADSRHAGAASAFWRSWRSARSTWGHARTGCPRRWCGAPVLAGEQARCQWPVGDVTDAQFGAGRAGDILRAWWAVEDAPDVSVLLRTIADFPVGVAVAS